MRNKYLLIGIIIFVVGYLSLFVIAPYHYNDPDSYYYLAMTEHIEHSDGTLLGFVSYHLGLWGARILLLLCMVISAWLLFDFTYNINKKSALFCTFIFLICPTIMFVNGWFGHLDKNIIEVMLFLVFIQIQMVLFYGKDAYAEMIYGVKKKISWYYVYFGLLAIFFIISSLLWQGWKIFFIYAVLYGIIFILAVRRHELKNKSVIFILVVTSLLSLYMIFITYSSSFSLVIEDRLSLYSLMLPELTLFVFLLFFNMNTIKTKYLQFLMMSIIILSSCWFYPRLMLFVPVLLCILISMIWDNLVAYHRYIIILPLVIMGLSMFAYYQTDEYNDILQMDKPCTNCTIIGDWSHGHVYRYAWNETVLYRGHPNMINEELDYLFYQNKTCPRCVKVFRHGDSILLHFYALEMHRENVTFVTEASGIIIQYPSNFSQ